MCLVICSCAVFLPLQKTKKKRESKKHKQKGGAAEEEGEGLVGEVPPTGSELLNLDLMDVNVQNAGQVSLCTLQCVVYGIGIRIS